MYYLIINPILLMRKLPLGIYNFSTHFVICIFHTKLQCEWIKIESDFFPVIERDEIHVIGSSYEKT
jgi:hypothetical protein